MVPYKHMSHDPEDVQADDLRVVIASQTDLGPFGNRTDVIVVDESTVRAVRHLDCPDTVLQHQYRWVDEGDTL